TQTLDVMNHPVEQWWTPSQLALVEDRSRVWHRKPFEPSPAVEHCVAGVRVLGPASADSPGANVVADGWDHEHCELCWAKISLMAGDAPEGYADGKTWICAECYDRFVHPRE